MQESSFKTVNKWVLSSWDEFSLQSSFFKKMPTQALFCRVVGHMLRISNSTR